MSHHHGQKIVKSIDQVIQNSQEPPMSDHFATRSTMSSPLTAPPSPNSHPKSLRNDNSSDRRPKSRDRDAHQASTTNSWTTKDYIGTMRSVRESDEDSGSTMTENGLTRSRNGGTSNNNFTDFFSSEVFHIVLHNPTTAHRLLRFCQSRACGENMEFLQQIDKYNRLLDETSMLLGRIHSTYASADAPRQINVSHSQIKQISSDIRHASQFTLPSLENILSGAQKQVEQLLATDIYPRFVKHQVTASATTALADQRERFQGLGDCFCLTDPSIADNPITYASDGFVSVTGYSRKDIIPRNCRFLQGDLTDPSAPSRLRTAIYNCDETVELLLNYRKNGDPFWNLLYVSPLYNEQGEVSFFLGGQINCSTTIHSCNDILRVLSLNDDELDKIDEVSKKKPPSLRTRDSSNIVPRVKSSFFKSFRKYKAPSVVVKNEAGQEPDLINRIGKMSFTTQVEAFYTAYSKYIVLEYHLPTESLSVKHHSAGIIDILCLNLPNGGIAPIFNKDIFRVLSEHASSSSSSNSKVFKQTVRDALHRGKAVSVEIGLLTGFAESKGSGWFSGGKEGSLRRVEERYITHWTPLKDQEGVVRFVVLSIAPKD